MSDLTTSTIGELRGSVRLAYHDFQTIPYDGLGHHLLDGVHIITPAPSTYHQGISARLFKHLVNFVDERGLGKVFSAPIDVKFSEYDGYQPDMLFIRNEDGASIKEENIVGPPTLIIEITSKESSRADYGWKKEMAEKYGVKEYWVVDTTYKIVEVFGFSFEMASKKHSETYSAGKVIESSLKEFRDLKIPVKGLF